MKLFFGLTILVLSSVVFSACSFAIVGPSVATTSAPIFYNNGGEGVVSGGEGGNTIRNPSNDAILVNPNTGENIINPSTGAAAVLANMVNPSTGDKIVNPSNAAYIVNPGA